jgi:uncharacterized membrane protein YfcA
MPVYLHYLIALGVGAGAGLLGGFFGISGGSIAIPAMAFLGHTQQTAQGTSLVMQLPNLAIGVWQYAKRGNIDVRKALVLSVAGLPFTYAGALTATHMRSGELRSVFGCFLIFVGSFTLWNAVKKPKRIAMLPMRWEYLSVLGACGGFATGLFGIGGPAIAVPSLVLLFGVAQTVGQAMGLFLAAPAVLVSLVAYALAGNVDWAAGIALAAGGAILVGQGVTFAHRLPDKALRVLFGGFIYTIAALMLAEAVR